LKASQVRQQYLLSFWDSIIVASALTAGVSVLYSEDMQHGLMIEEQLQVRNPFVQR
jgi:predicted nucleic acid-binding protein